MPTKQYTIKDATLQNIVSEPAVAYQTKSTATTNSWNPNVPFCGTQEEWWEHFHQIEEGEFMSLEEANREFAEWKKEYLANRLM
ncbi:MAG: hypothetical protein FWC39_08280 [Bacteroidetes bacterium]|nr:hypothetical protein [Bacteroidota bacterium]